eukprot:6489686-Amphidinium_carterae.1
MSKPVSDQVFCFDASLSGIAVCTGHSGKSLSETLAWKESYRFKAAQPLENPRQRALFERDVFSDVST